MDKKAPKKYQDPKETYKDAVREGTKKAVELKKPHYYGRIEGVHVFHATDKAHGALVGMHIHNPDDSKLNETLSEAKDKGFPTVVIHGAPPESLRTSIHPKLGAVSPGEVQKSEVKPVSFDDLQKTFLQPDLTTQSDIKAHTGAMATLHPALLKWGTEKLSPLPKDAVESLDLAGHKIKVRKHDADLYSGRVIAHNGDKVHQFERITLPEVMTQIHSKLELYGKEAQVTGNQDIPDVESQIKTLRDRIRSYLDEAGLSEGKEPHEAFDETAEDEKKEAKEFKETNPSESEQMGFDEMNELEEQLKDIHRDIEAGQDSVTVPGKELVDGILNPEEECPACERPVDQCVCWQNMPKPRLEFDGKKVTIFFKSEIWDDESKASFIQDLKRRAGRLLYKKLS